MHYFFILLLDSTPVQALNSTASLQVQAMGCTVFLQAVLHLHAELAFWLRMLVAAYTAHWRILLLASA